MLQERLGDERGASAEPPAVPKHVETQQMPISVDTELFPQKVGMLHHKHMGSKGAHTPSPLSATALTLRRQRHIAMPSLDDPL